MTRATGQSPWQGSLPIESLGVIGEEEVNPGLKKKAWDTSCIRDHFHIRDHQAFAASAIDTGSSSAIVPFLKVL